MSNPSLHPMFGSQAGAATAVLNAAALGSEWTPGFGSVKRAERPFVTLSRQPGAGAMYFATQLADRLNRNGRQDWSAWDRQQVERIAAEHGDERDLVGNRAHSRFGWMMDIFDDFSENRSPAEVAEANAYKRIVKTIHAMATAGHVIIVGRGGAFITQQMPGAVHIRLVAPLEHRIRQVAQASGVTAHSAAGQIARAEQEREEFYRRYWPRRTMASESYTFTLNAAALSANEMIESVLPAIRARQACRNCARCAKQTCVRDA